MQQLAPDLRDEGFARQWVIGWMEVVVEDEQPFQVFFFRAPNQIVHVEGIQLEGIQLKFATKKRSPVGCAFYANYANNSATSTGRFSCALFTAAITAAKV